MNDIKEPLISIIIPVYNVELYLERCLDSVLACNLTDLEIILSLGNSRDKSDDICKRYQENNPLIKVIHQEGKGLSNARNCAMRIARGEYILFIDSDDYVDSTVLDFVIAKLRKREFVCDLLVTDFSRILQPSGKVEKVFQIGENTPDQAGMAFLPQMLTKKQCFWNVWRYVYRRSFLEENSISFLENRMSEDIDFTAKVFVAEPEIIFSHSPFYFYNVGRGNSLMDCPTKQRLEDTVLVISQSIKMLEASKFQYAHCIEEQFRFEYLLNIAQIVEVNLNDQNEACSLFRDWMSILGNSRDVFIRLSCLYLRVLGLKRTAKALHILKVFRRRLLGRN